MKQLKKTISFSVLIGILVFGGCKKDEQAISPPVPGNEFMTTVKLRFQNAANPNDTLWATWKDLTPDDANPPDTSQAIIGIHMNTTYHVTVHFYDETQHPTQDLTQEILDRANYHLYVFFKTGGIANDLTITPTDHDTNNPPLPIGLSDDFVTGNTATTGRLEGVLRHQPNSKNGTFAPGSTDSDTFFSVTIN